MQLGLLGCGYWGKNLIRDFRNLNVLHTICDTDMEQLKKHQTDNVNITTNADDIFSSTEITAVCIALPANIHYKFAKLALQAGKDVFCEKPITLDVAQAQELVDLAREKELILMVGHLLHYHPCIAKMKEMVQDGKIGKIVHIVSNRLNLGILRTCENVLWSFAPHDISVILSLCQNKLPNRVTCHGKSHMTFQIHDITNSVLEFDDTYVNINVSWLNPFKEQKLTLVGDKGMLVFDDTLKENKLVWYPEYIGANSILKKDFEPVPVAMDGPSPLQRECQHFIDVCKTRQQPLTDGQEGVRVLKTLMALQKSLTSGMTIDCREQDVFIHESSTVDAGAVIGTETNRHYSYLLRGTNCQKCNIKTCYCGAILGNHCKVQTCQFTRSQGWQ